MQFRNKECGFYRIESWLLQERKLKKSVETEIVDVHLFPKCFFATAAAFSNIVLGLISPTNCCKGYKRFMSNLI